MTDLKRLRPDWKIAQFLSKEVGLEMAREWMRASFVDLRHVEIDWRAPASSFWTRENQLLPWSRLLWNSAVYAWYGTIALAEYEGEMHAGMNKQGQGFNADPTQCGVVLNVVWVRQYEKGDRGYRSPLPKRVPTMVFKDRPELESLYIHGEREFPIDPEDVSTVAECFRVLVWDPATDTQVRESEAHNGRPLEDACTFVDPHWYYTLAVLGAVDDLHGTICIWDSTVTGAESFELRQRKVVVNMWPMVPVMDYLETTAEHFVEVRPEPKARSPQQRAKRDKTTRLFPWLDEDAPRIVMLDPAEHCQRSTPQGGTHASPIPHQRKGNYALLQAPRFRHKQGQKVWRKPAWVGDREWIHHGSVYRVLEDDPREESDNAKDQTGARPDMGRGGQHHRSSDSGDSGTG